MRNSKGQFESTSLNDRFFSKVSLPNENGCMLWFGAKDSWGYGHLTINKTTKKAHRLAYEMTKGEILKGMFICHTCDTPSCVNPDHLFLGSPRDNVIDCIKKGRFPLNKGERVGNSKLNNRLVVEIRCLLNYGYSQREVSRMYGVTSQNINLIHHNKAWRHVK
tara:strand:+ start:2171 stop:2659 length:489 start_codon:yes stop_codon:yes gene_type:complete